MEFLLSFVLGFGVTWALSTQQQKSNSVHLQMAELLDSKYGKSHRVINVVKELSIENINRGDRDYESVLIALHEKEKGYGS